MLSKLATIAAKRDITRNTMASDSNDEERKQFADLASKEESEARSQNTPNERRIDTNSVRSGAPYVLALAIAKAVDSAISATSIENTENMLSMTYSKATEVNTTHDDGNEDSSTKILTHEYSAKIVRGTNLGLWEPEQMYCINSNEHATYATLLVTTVGADSNSTRAEAKLNSIETKDSAVESMRRAMKAVVQEANGRANYYRDNNDARGFATAVIGKMVAHNTATRFKSTAEGVTELMDGELTMPDTCLSWPLAMAYSSVMQGLTPVPANFGHDSVSELNGYKILEMALAKLARPEYHMVAPQE